MGSLKICDHTGQEFPSMTAMADFYGIPDSTLQGRLSKGMSMEQALTATEEDLRKLSRHCMDHLGNSFPSKKAMCAHYGIPTSLFFSRRHLGWSLEQALTEPVYQNPSNSRSVTDHENNQFPSVSAMCKHWGMTRSTYNARIKNGWSVEDALTTPQKQIRVTPKKCIDHLGQEFPSLNAMCRHWGTNKDTYKTRTEKLGWSMEKALTQSEIVIYGKPVTDYKGRTFPTVCDMCHFYGFHDHDLQGKEITEELFQKVIRRRYQANRVFGQATIKKQLTFPYFMVQYQEEEYIWTLEQILDEYHAKEFLPFSEKKLRNLPIKITKCLNFPHYEVLVNGHTETWDYWQILTYRKETNYGLSKAAVSDKL